MFKHLLDITMKISIEVTQLLSTQRGGKKGNIVVDHVIEVSKRMGLNVNKKGDITLLQKTIKSDWHWAKKVCLSI